MNKTRIARIEYIIAMIIYGTSGCFSKYIGVPAGFMVFSRAIIGSIILTLYLLIRRQKVNFEAIKKNLLWLILGGASIGCNWMCLFSSYNLISVSVASLCNYLAPALFIVVTVFLFKEKLSLTKILCVLVALVGIVLLSGIIGDNNNLNSLGVILGICAAIFYVGILLFNKFIHDIDPIEKALIELMVVGVVTAPYAFISLDYNNLNFDLTNIILLLILGIFHTGIAYIL